MAANMQYPYKEINLAETQGASSKHDHRTALPATFCSQNTKTGALLPFSPTTQRAVSWDDCGNPAPCYITRRLPGQPVTERATN